MYVEAAPPPFTRPTRLDQDIDWLSTQLGEETKIILPLDHTHTLLTHHLPISMLVYRLHDEWLRLG